MTNRKPKALLALFAATAALAGGAQALAPAPAAAVRTVDCSDEWAMVLGLCTHVTEGEGNGGGDASAGDQAGPGEPYGGGDYYGGREDQPDGTGTGKNPDRSSTWGMTPEQIRNWEYVQGRGRGASWLPYWIEDDDINLHVRMMRMRHDTCVRILDRMRTYVKDLRGDKFEVDRHDLGGNSHLKNWLNQWDEGDCGFLTGTDI